jgi:hypothetical protein
VKAGDLVRHKTEKSLNPGLVIQRRGRSHCMVIWPSGPRAHDGPEPTLEADSGLEIISEAR